jgi:hypothetical protein
VARIDADQYRSLAEISLNHFPGMRYLRVGLSLSDNHTTDPGAVRPIIEPVLGQLAVTTLPSARRTSARKALVALDQRASNERAGKAHGGARYVVWRFDDKPLVSAGFRPAWCALRDMILVLTQNFPPRIGGIEGYIGQLVNALVTRGERVIVFADANRGSQAYDAKLANVEVHRFAGPRPVRRLSKAWAAHRLLATAPCRGISATAGKASTCCRTRACRSSC